ncbi:hypothetical protein [Rossellomorea sp. YZS02]|uniref:hypothetical protein n=1 Tax=Rossellomorea sp. YZS02 TaxID=3097358 RepID=UPI002A0DE73E|nr:hypothetical protein [Rossellomorea sp. YZS02]MDX8342214.1 hypothetical protein [Rossellomorea sp. YZS02]
MSEYMQKWERIREKGKLNYMVSQSLLSGLVCFLTLLLFSVLFNTPLTVGLFIYQSIFLGVVLSVTSWITNEKRYKKHKQK